MAKRKLYEDAPYQQSRAALRERYGTRRIDASAPQSDRDFTPSGRIRYREMQGMSEQAAGAATERDFYDMIKGRPLNQPAPVLAPVTPTSGATSSFRPSSPGFSDPVNPAAVVPVGGGPYTPPVPPKTTPGAFGSATSSFPPQAPAFTPAVPSNLTPLSFNLSEPSSLPASAIAQYSPIKPADSYVPSWKKRSNPGYMGSILAPASKWLA